MTLLHHIPLWMARLLPDEEVCIKLQAWLTKCLARLLLLSYALLLLKPVMPIIADNLAHTFWKNVHIAVVHKINGKEHVHYELRKMGAESQKDKSGFNTKASSEDVCLLPSFRASDSPRILLQSQEKPLAYYLRSHCDAESPIESPPPKKA